MTIDNVALIIISGVGSDERGRNWWCSGGDIFGQTTGRSEPEKEAGHQIPLQPSIRRRLDTDLVIKRNKLNCISATPGLGPRGRGRGMDYASGSSGRGRGAGPSQRGAAMGPYGGYGVYPPAGYGPPPYDPYYSGYSGYGPGYDMYGGYPPADQYYGPAAQYGAPPMRGGVSCDTNYSPFKVPYNLYILWNKDYGQKMLLSPHPTVLMAAVVVPYSADGVGRAQAEWDAAWAPNAAVPGLVAERKGREATLADRLQNGADAGRTLLRMCRWICFKGMGRVLFPQFIIFCKFKRICLCFVGNYHHRINRILAPHHFLK